MTSVRRRVAGLTVCGLLASWLLADDMARRIDDAQSSADMAQESAYKIDDLERRVGDLERYRPY